MTEQRTPTISAATNARCMKSYSNGVSRTSIRPGGVRARAYARESRRMHRSPGRPGRTGGEYLPIDDDHPVEPLRRTIEVVGCHEDRQPAADPLAYQREQNLFGRRIDARRRLVEEQDARLLRERARDERPLLLSARELRDVPTREAAQPQRFYRRIDDLAIVRSEAFPRTQVRKPAHRDDVPHAHREAPIDFFDLRDVSDRPGRQTARSFPEDFDDPGGRLDEAGDGLEERRFPGAVRTDDPERLTLVHQEIDVVERGDRAEADGERAGANGAHLRAFTIVSVS